MEDEPIRSAEPSAPETVPFGGRFRWVIGTPYFVQGTSSLTEVPILYFIKFTLGLGDAGGQLFDSLRFMGWFVKPLWGFISDRVPLFGYRRKSWYVLMALLALFFWLVNAVLASFELYLPSLFLLSLSLAFATYAFVDVVCDALMVTYGRKHGNVGRLVNFQWTVLGASAAGAVLLGAWFQEQIQQGLVPLSAVFLAAAVAPLFTAYVGLRYIREEPVEKRSKKPEPRPPRRAGKPRPPLRGLAAGLREQKPLVLLTLFIFFWKLTPSVGYIERSYLIDARAFEPSTFGIILSIGSVIFLLSVLAYRWTVQRFPRITWYHYLYAMVALGVLSFPLSFFLYLDQGHPWWNIVLGLLPAATEGLSTWNRYEWFRLVTQTLFGFASLPAFIIPLTLAGETVNVANAGMQYAFLMSFSNVMFIFEGAIGAALYGLLSRPPLNAVVRAFEGSPLDIAKVSDERTLILEIFVYIGLFTTLLTIPFIHLLRKEYDRRGLRIHLGGGRQDGAEQDPRRN